MLTFIGKGVVAGMTPLKSERGMIGLNVNADNPAVDLLDGSREKAKPLFVMLPQAAAMAAKLALGTRIEFKGRFVLYELEGISERTKLPYIMEKHKLVLDEVKALAVS